MGGLLAWPTTAANPQITMEIHISDWTHKVQKKTGLDAKANSELYKSNRVNSVGNLSSAFENILWVKSEVLCKVFVCSTVALAQLGDCLE